MGKTITDKEFTDFLESVLKEIVDKAKFRFEPSINNREKLRGSLDLHDVLEVMNSNVGALKCSFNEEPKREVSLKSVIKDLDSLGYTNLHAKIEKRTKFGPFLGGEHIIISGDKYEKD